MRDAGRSAVDRVCHRPYYRLMENELRALEERVEQLATLARRLRGENTELRQSLLAAQNEARGLREKVETASVRLQRLLDRLPEDAG